MTHSGDLMTWLRPAWSWISRGWSQVCQRTRWVVTFSWLSRVSRPVFNVRRHSLSRAALTSELWNARWVAQIFDRCHNLHRALCLTRVIVYRVCARPHCPLPCRWSLRCWCRTRSSKSREIFSIYFGCFGSVAHEFQPSSVIMPHLIPWTILLINLSLNALSNARNSRNHLYLALHYSKQFY